MSRFISRTATCNLLRLQVSHRLVLKVSGTCHYRNTKVPFHAFDHGFEIHQCSTRLSHFLQTDENNLNIRKGSLIQHSWTFFVRELFILMPLIQNNRQM